ncbi:MAG TPA: VTT domain-containing protein [Deltaproteobacteria bacterium]|nr:VTT domain-containing protein [Deltaproteobacteria bacterium]
MTLNKPAQAASEIQHVHKPFFIRIILAVVLITCLIAAGRITGAHQYFTPERVQDLVHNAGFWGYVLFIIVFSLGELFHIFGLIFVAAGVYAFGKFTGLILGIVGGTIAVCVSFLVMRTVGGRAFTRIDKPWVVRMLQRLDAHPIRTVAILRLVFIMYPSLNYILALTSIRFRDYMIGSAIGLVIPISVFVIFFDWLVALLI